MKKFTYLLLLIATFTISSFASKADGIVDIVVNSEDHTTLETAVVAAELAEALSAEGPFTVFAPTDAAFGEIPSETLNALL
ncbi:MAG: fasciclin domain-containing protein, partial [Prolixibacteraceae bacterium]|nr:fasciclin domain-containing protein [Prolixibacteraceae bacterium]